MSDERLPIPPIDDVKPDQPSIVTQVGGALFWSQLLKFIEVGTSIFFLLTVIRILGPAEYGLFGTITSVAAVILLFTMPGFTDAISRYVPQANTPEGGNAVGYLARRVLTASVILLVIAAFVVWFLRGAIAHYLHFRQIYSLYPIVMGLAAGQTLSAILSTSNIAIWRMKTVFFITGAVNVIAAVGALILVLTRSDTAESAAMAAVVAFAFGFTTFLLVSRKWLFRKPERPADMRPVWKFAGSVWGVRVSNFATGGNIIILLMGWLLGSQKEVAYFNCAYVPMMRIQQLILGWTLSVLPSLSSLKVARGADPLYAAYRLYVKLSTGLAVPVMAFVALHAKPLITGVFGRSFSPAGGTLQVYAALSLAALVAGSGLTTLVLYTLDMAGKVVRLRIGTAVVHLAMVCILIPRYGALGAVIGLGITGIVAAIVEITFIPKASRRMFPTGFVAKTLAVSGVCLGATILAHPRSMVSLTVVGFAYMAVYFLLISRWHPLDPSEKEILGRHPRMAKVVGYL